MHVLSSKAVTTPTFELATSRRPTLLVKYLEIYLIRLEQWLSEWRIAINISNSSGILFAKPGWRFSEPLTVQLFEEPIKWVHETRYLVVTVDKRLTWSKHVDQERKEMTERLGILGPLLNRRSGLSIKNGVLLFKQLIRPMITGKGSSTALFLSTH